MVMVWHDIKLIYFLVPHTGSTSLVAAFREKFGDSKESINGHVTSREARQRLAPEIWQTYHKVGAIRDPYEWAMTGYQRPNHIDLDPASVQTLGEYPDFLSWLHWVKPPMWWLTDEQGDLLVNEMFTLETIDEFAGRYGVEVGHHNRSSHERFRLNAAEQKQFDKVFERELAYYAQIEG